MTTFVTQQIIKLLVTTGLPLWLEKPEKQEKGLFSFWIGKVGKASTFSNNVGWKRWKFFLGIHFLYTVKLTNFGNNPDIERE